MATPIAAGAAALLRQCDRTTIPPQRSQPPLTVAQVLARGLVPNGISRFFSLNQPVERAAACDDDAGEEQPPVLVSFSCILVSIWFHLSHAFLLEHSAADRRPVEVPSA